MNKIFSILITGTSRGIGKELAINLLSKGHQVIGCSRGKASISHVHYKHLIIDLNIEEDVLSVMKYVRQNYKQLDVLINCAAINPAIITAAFLPSNILKEVFAVNIIAPMLLCRDAIKLMSRKKFGRIINLSSMATKHEVAGEALYTSTKSALVSYTRVIAKEIYNLGITANVISPAAIETDLSKQINKEALQEVLNRNAIKNFGSFDDVNNLVEFLISSESNAITGQEIFLGGV